MKRTTASLSPSLLVAECRYMLAICSLRSPGVGESSDSQAMHEVQQVSSHEDLSRTDEVDDGHIFAITRHNLAVTRETFAAIARRKRIELGIEQEDPSAEQRMNDHYQDNVRGSTAALDLTRCHWVCICSR